MARLDRAHFAQYRPANWTAEKMELFVRFLEMGDVIDDFDRVRTLIADASPAGNDLRTSLIDYTRALGQRFLQA